MPGSTGMGGELGSQPDASVPSPVSGIIIKLRAPRGKTASFSSERVRALAYLALGTAPWV